MSELRNNVTSEWIKATGFFGHTPSRTPVLLFVEGDDDVPLWEEAVKPYQTKYDISVKTNKSVNPGEENGKTKLLTMSGLGVNKVVAVDADYDLLIDGYSSYTDMVRNSPFVVNTTWYSIENILLQKSSQVDMLEKFSNAFAKWFYDFMMSVAEHRIESPTKCFGKLLSQHNVQTCAASNDFTSISNDSSKIPEEKITDLKKYIEGKGYSDSSIWKLMRGHNLWNTIVKPVEEKSLKSKINAEVSQQISHGLNANRNTAMQKMGIHDTVSNHLEHQFYFEDLQKVALPSETRRKLDNLFKY